ncbi:Sterol 24-C-methyltransferase [Zancudomyces culisetae]|uniref:Sterol 24-C-methyltransferase n=1 Tax=Zancudomyces culisetae TaxID=1213189 RepID=A0A1R1PGQ5_ZANCU|nr:Sterol 24-C-methyltransferase [Zancudomyces culisetae]OMH82372.1 Sterol 24-C-methyltransferase [Zancudomyces culisetae]|eukprot:OMH80093.1 Sterol 24-C-methyltransferase [Zancudomyces culisetae]
MPRAHQDEILDPTPETSTLLHGADVVIPNSPFESVKTMAKKNREVFDSSYNTYENFWGNDRGKTVDKRSDKYKVMTNTFYNLVTDFYEYGWGQSFHFARRSETETFDESIDRHEHLLFSKARIEKGDKVLDVGCGVGGPARQCVKLTGAHVTGINNNDYQLEKATKNSAKLGLSENTKFVKGDFMNMPFEHNSFDAVYAIEATCHAPDLVGVYKQIYNVLKPGGRAAIYEWCTTDTYDPSNPKHAEVISGIEYGNSLPKLFSTKECLSAIEKAGFELVYSEDLAITGPGNEMPWYSDLFQDFISFKSLRAFIKSVVGRKISSGMLALFGLLRIIPKAIYDTNEILLEASDSCVAGGKHNIFTPMFLVVARKPLDSQ